MCKKNKESVIDVSCQDEKGAGNRCLFATDIFIYTLFSPILDNSENENAFNAPENKTVENTKNDTISSPMEIC